LGEQAAAVLRSAGGDAHTIPMDVTRPAEIRSAVEQIDSRFGRLDVLINNAGIEIAVRLATTDPHGPTGGFFDEDGPVPW
jgi:NAD(P)-dependent dehydrogenase (short-subunit alcohol dehydrogenase family)